MQKWCAALWLALLVPSCARAAHPSVGSPSPPLQACAGSGSEHIEVTLLGAARVPALRDAICDWLRADVARVEFMSAPTSAPIPPASAASLRRVVVELPAPSQARLQVDVARTSGAPERWSWDVELPARFDAAGVEVIAQALHSTLEAARGAPRQTSADAPGPSAEPVDRGSERTAAHLEPSPLILRAGVAYQFHARGDEPLTHGPAVNVELGLDLGTVSVGGFVRAGGFTSGRARFADLELVLRGLDLGAGLSAQAPLGSWAFRLAAGPSLELISRQLSVLDPNAVRQLEDQPSRPRPFVSAEAGIGFLSGPVAIGVIGLLRWQLAASHYDVLDMGQPTTVMRPWRWQPGGAVEVSYSW